MTIDYCVNMTLKSGKLIVPQKQSLMIASFMASILLSGTTNTASANNQNYFDLDPEQLLNAQVVSVSKREEKLSEAPAAVYVITNEDIIRSGVTTIPDALRMAPGVQVAQSDSNSWVISIRGFSTALSNKLLVMIDGRTVYNPLFAGTYWEAQDVMLQDVERIEIVRGPGGTLWGANAVDGIINIITKSSKDTQGNLVSAGYGTHEKGFLDGRHGGSLGDNDYYRVYAKSFDRNSYERPDGSEGTNDWKSGRSGFRMDFDDKATLQGDIYQTETNQLSTIPDFSAAGFNRVKEENVTYRGANILGRWKEDLENGRALQLQSYLDYSERNEDPLLYDRRIMFDTEVQYNMPQIGRHELTLGAGYRFTADDEETRTLDFAPNSRMDNLFSAFAQDKIALSPEELYLILGSKFEHNDYTGFEVQPNARLQWLADEKQTVWASVSRAVRTPSRLEHDMRWTLANTAGPNQIQLVGNEDFESEELIAYELGYRNQLTNDFSVDVATFYNDYKKLAAFNALPPIIGVNNGVDPVFDLFPFNFTNGVKGEVYGIEIASNWDVTDNWNLAATYTVLDVQLHADNPTLVNPEGPEDATPNHQANLRSSWNISEDWTFDTALYYVDRMKQNNVSDYLRMDANLGWKIDDSIRFNLVGQNLLGTSHREYGSRTALNAEEIERSVYGRLTWEF